MNKAAVIFQNVTLQWEDKPVISHFSCEIPHGSKSVFSAPSGRGKSTLLKSIAGFIMPLSGEIRVLGYVVKPAGIHRIRQELSYVPQDFPFSKRTCDFIMLPFSFAANRHLKPGEDEVLHLFDELLLDRDTYTKPMTEISGGEKQRVALITALLLKKKILLLDEPVASLDSESRKRVIQYVTGLKEVTVISASHDKDWLDHCNPVIGI